MNISNKTLGLLLVAAIVVSLGGTFVSLDLLDGFSSTGLATTGAGEVNLTINATLNIVLNKSSINFGECTLVPAIPSVFSSLDGPAVGDNILCNGQFPDNITIDNSGNVDMGVTVQSVQIASGEYASAGTPMFAFLATNMTGSPGCDAGKMTKTWTDISVAGAPGVQNVCTTVDFTDGSDNIMFFVRMTLPADSVGVGIFDLTFTAVPAT